LTLITHNLDSEEECRKQTRLIEEKTDPEMIMCEFAIEKTGKMKFEMSLRDCVSRTVGS
jgi:hypothetical protein